MTKRNETGIYQLANGNWSFRYTITTDGHKKDVRKSKDEFGNPLKTKTEAIRARNRAIERERDGRKPAQKQEKRSKKFIQSFAKMAEMIEHTEPNKNRTVYGIITSVLALEIAS